MTATHDTRMGTYIYLYLYIYKIWIAEDNAFFVGNPLLKIVHFEHRGSQFGTDLTWAKTK